MIPRTAWVLIAIASAIFFFIPDPLDAVFGIGTIVELLIGILATIKAIRG